MGGICTWMWMLVVLGEVQVVSYTDVKGAPQAAPPIPGALQPPLSLLAAASLEPLSPDSVRLIPRLSRHSRCRPCGTTAAVQPLILLLLLLDMVQKNSTCLFRP